MLGSTPLTLLNVYVPPGGLISFYQTLSKVLLDALPDLLLPGGDFNGLMNAGQECQSPPIQSRLSATPLASFAGAYSYCDTWCHLQPTLRQFTFLSQAHKSFFSLDYFFLPTADIAQIMVCHFHPCSLSNHSLVEITTGSATHTHKVSQ